MQDDLAKLGLLNNSIATRDTALKQLCAAAWRVCRFLLSFGLLIQDGQITKRTYSNSRYTSRSIDRKLKKIVDTGIPLTLTDREEPLPPLSITYDE